MTFRRCSPLRVFTPLASLACVIALSVAPALQAAPWWGIGAVAAASVLIGLWLPLVGWTLLAFLAVDTMLGIRRHRGRARR